jgi:hypothetical protein
MDADTIPPRALDEGVADGVSLALEPAGHRSRRAQATFAHEARSASWRRKTWEQQQRNEYFVSAVVRAYLGEGREARRRLVVLVGALDRRRPASLQELLQGLADVDPVEARGRLDRILGKLGAGWDSESAELALLRAEGR